jgi:hypothetical protein
VVHHISCLRKVKVCVVCQIVCLNSAHILSAEEKTKESSRKKEQKKKAKKNDYAVEADIRAKEEAARQSRPNAK